VYRPPARVRSKRPRPAATCGSVAADQTIKPTRCAQVAFSNPTESAGEPLLVLQGNPKNLHGSDDIRKNADVNVAVPSGSVQLDYLHAYKIPDDRIVIIPQQADAPTVLQGGRADAYTIEDNAGNLLLKSGQVKGFELADPFTVPVINGKPALSYGGITFKHDDAEFVRAFNEALKQFVQTPEFWEINRKNGMADNVIQRALKMTAAEQCAEQ
jgi:polar amino acid transport system substrate-binding protein